MGNDITKPKRAEEALRDANQFNIEIFSQAGEGIVVYDRNLCYVVWNQFMERLTGALTEDIIGRKALDLFPHLIEQGVDRLLKRALNGETVTSPDLPFHSPFTNQNGWVVGTYAPHRNALGEIIGVIGTVLDITERKRAEDALQEAKQAAEDSKAQYEHVVSMISDIVWRFDVNAKGEHVGSYISLVADSMLGLPYGTIGDSYEKYISYIHPDDLQGVQEMLSQGIMTLSMDLAAEYRLQKADGTTIWVRSKGSAYSQSNGIVTVFGTTSDITESKQAAISAKLARDALDILNRPGSFTDTIRDILQLIMKRTGIEAAGIRLRQGDDFPYYYTSGFPSDFVQTERFLCARDDSGQIISDERGNPILKCMCGNVILGRTDNELPFFTAGGSFWTNSTTDLLATTTEQERQTYTRNRCNKEGYESVALIPLRSSRETIGLLQLNDRRRNQFTPEMIALFEDLGNSIGIALSRRQTEEALNENRTRRELAIQSAQMGSWVFDFVMNKRDFDAQTCHLLGIDHATFQGSPDEFFRVVHPSDRDVIQAALTRSIEQDALYESTYRVIHPDGSIRHIVSRGRVIHDQNSSSPKLIGIMWDDTERKRAEEALRTSEAFLNSIIDQSPLSMWISNDRGTLIRINQACRDLLHISDEDVVGKYNIFEDDIVEEQGFMPLVRGVFEAGETAHFEIKYDSSQLKHIHIAHFASVIIAVTVFPIRDSRGKITNAVIQHIDITERKNAEEALRESEERYRTVVSSASDGIILQDSTGKILTWNTTVEKVFGVKAAEILDHTSNLRSWRTIREDGSEFPGAEHPSVHTLTTGETCKNAVMGVRNATTDQLSWISISTSPLFRGGEPKPYAVAISFSDITERKRTEEALKAERDRAEQYLNTVEVILVALDTEARITLLNRKGYQILGYEEGELIGRDWIETCLRPQDHESVREANRKIVSGKIKLFEYYESYILNKKGEERSIAWHTTIIKDEVGRITGTLSSGEDITERKKTEEKNQQLAAIVESSADAIFMVLLDGTITNWNKGAERVYGYTENEIIGQTITLLASPERQDEVPQILERLRQGEHIDHYESLCRRKDGQQFPVDLTISPIYDIKGKIVGTSSIVRDITERKLAVKEIENLARFPDENPNPVLRIAADGTITYANLGSAPLMRLWDCQVGQKLPDDYRNLVLAVLCPGDLNEIEVLAGDRVFSLVIAPIPEQDYVNIYGRDVTEHRQAEKALRDSEKRYRQIVDTASEGIMAVDENFIIAFVNAKMTNILGYSPGEMIGFPVHHFMFEEDLQDHERRKVVRMQGVTEQYERRFCRKDGKTIWVSISASPLKDSQDRFLGSFAMLTDISDRKETEMALKESERRLKDIISFLPDATFVVDKEGKVTAWNKAMEEMTGVSEDDMIGQGDHACTVPFYGERRQHLIDLLDKDDEEIASKYQFVQRKGDTLYSETFTPALHGGKGAYVWATVGPIYDVHGNRVGAIESIRDITDRKQAEDELKRVQSSLRIAMDLVKLVQWEYDVETDMFAFDDQFYALYGTTADREGGPLMSSQDYARKFIPAEDASIVAEETSKALATTDPNFTSQVEHRIIRADGTEGFIAVRFGIIKNSKGRTIRTYGANQDITDRKRAEDELRESEQRLANLIDFLPDATFAVDLEGKVIAWNRAIEEMTGVAKDDMLDRSDYAYAVPFYGEPRPILIDLVIQDQKEIDSKYSNLIRKGDQIIAEASTPMLNKGKGAYVWCVASPLYDSKGSIVGAIESLRDITEHKQAEEALRESEERYRNLVERANDGIIIIQDGLIKYANSRSGMIWDSTVEEIVGKPFIDYVHPEEIPQMVERYRQRMTSEYVESRYETTLMRKDGSKIFVELNAGLIIFLGKPADLVLVRDITKRKQMEVTLRESKDYLGKIINSIGDPIFVIDRQHRHVLVNDAMCALANRTREDFIGKTPYDFFPREQVDVFVRNDEAIFETGKENVNEETITDSHGVIRTIITKKTLYTDASGNKSIVGIIREITERKRAEDALRKAHDELEMRVKERTEELARKNTEMERFIYTVSHDLRTPLISISGFLGFIMQDTERGDMDRLKTDLRIANEAVIKMDRLLMETLELSRIGRVVNLPEDIPFGEIVEDALGQTGEKIKSKGCKVSVAQNLPVVHVDRMRIAEVLVNLIENSMKYIGVQANPEIEIGQRIDGKDIIFFVRDNGIGIDPSQYDKVFELFYKVEKKSEGTGAGLAIVKRIIEVHGGRIWIESELGKGCTVCFTLPLA